MAHCDQKQKRKRRMSSTSSSFFLNLCAKLTHSRTFITSCSSVVHLDILRLRNEQQDKEEELGNAGQKVESFPCNQKTYQYGGNATDCRYDRDTVELCNNVVTSSTFTFVISHCNANGEKQKINRNCNSRPNGTRHPLKNFNQMTKKRPLMMFELNDRNSQNAKCTVFDDANEIIF